MVPSGYWPTTTLLLSPRPTLISLCATETLSGAGSTFTTQVPFLLFWVVTVSVAVPTPLAVITPVLGSMVATSGLLDSKVHTLYTVVLLNFTVTAAVSPWPSVTVLLEKATEEGAAQTVTLQVSFTPL